MAQTLRLTSLTLVMPLSVAATMSQCSRAVTKWVALVGIVAQPVEQLGESPLVRVDAAAPLDAFEAELMSLAGDLFGFSEGAVVAPEVVVVERLKVLADGNDAGAGGVEGDGGNIGAVDAGGVENVARGGGEGGHLVGVRLGGVVGIFAAAMQRVGGRGGADGAFAAVNESDANAECAEIDAGNDSHNDEASSKRLLIRRPEYTKELRNEGTGERGSMVDNFRAGLGFAVFTLAAKTKTLREWGTQVGGYFFSPGRMEVNFDMSPDFGAGEAAAGLAGEDAAEGLA